MHKDLKEAQAKRFIEKFESHVKCYFMGSSGKSRIDTAFTNYLNANGIFIVRTNEKYEEYALCSDSEESLLIFLKGFLDTNDTEECLEYFEENQ